MEKHKTSEPKFSNRLKLLQMVLKQEFNFVGKHK